MSEGKSAAPKSLFGLPVVVDESAELPLPVFGYTNEQLEDIVATVPKSHGTLEERVAKVVADAEKWRAEQLANMIQFERDKA